MTFFLHSKLLSSTTLKFSANPFNVHFPFPSPAFRRNLNFLIIASAPRYQILCNNAEHLSLKVVYYLKKRVIVSEFPSTPIRLMASISSKIIVPKSQNQSITELWIMLLSNSVYSMFSLLFVTY